MKGERVMCICCCGMGVLWVGREEVRRYNV